MKKIIVLCCLALVDNLYGIRAFAEIVKVCDLRLMTTIVNQYMASSKESMGIVPTLRLMVIEKQGKFESDAQIQFAARCKFIRAMLMVHDITTEQDIVDASELFLQAAKGGDTDAIEAILIATNKSSINDVLDIEKLTVLDLIKQYIPILGQIKESFLQQHIIKNVVDALASVAANNRYADIRFVIPITSDGIDDAILTQTRVRFSFLLGSTLPLVSDADSKQILSYIENLESFFQTSQEESFGVSVHERLKPTETDGHTINPQIFRITGGFNEIIATSPDKALGPQIIQDYILEDFGTAVTFIKAVGLIASKSGTDRLHSMKQQLLAFSHKWSGYNVAKYLSQSSVDHISIAEKFMRSIGTIINDVR